MRIIALLAAVVPIAAAACQGALADPAARAAGGAGVLAACEAHARAQLAAPDSYRRVEVTSADRPVAGEAGFEQAVGIEAPRKGDPDRELWELTQVRYEAHRIDLRTVALAFEGDGARLAEQCAFRLVDGAPEDAALLLRRATESSPADGMRTLAEVRGDRPRRRPVFACCY